MKQRCAAKHALAQAHHALDRISRGDDIVRIITTDIGYGNYSIDVKETPDPHDIVKCPTCERCLKCNRLHTSDT